jgi:hypothetical protein
MDEKQKKKKSSERKQLNRSVEKRKNDILILEMG